MKRRISIEERFWDKVDILSPEGCWLWTGSTVLEGYGRICLGGYCGPMIRAHRFSYELFKGKIPHNLTIDHLCRVKNCVNPLHLEVVSTRENTLRGTGPTALNVKKTHCVHGHEFDKTNTYFRKTGRACRACCRIRTQTYRDKRAQISR